MDMSNHTRRPLTRRAFLERLDTAYRTAQVWIGNEEAASQGTALARYQAVYAREALRLFLTGDDAGARRLLDLINGQAEKPSCTPSGDASHAFRPHAKGLAATAAAAVSPDPSFPDVPVNGGHRPLSLPVLGMVQVSLLSAVVLLRQALDTDGPASPSEDGGEADLYRGIQTKHSEITALILRAEDPQTAAMFVLERLPQSLDYATELLYGPRRRPGLGSFVARCQELGTELTGQEARP